MDKNKKSKKEQDNIDLKSEQEKFLEKITSKLVTPFEDAITLKEIARLAVPHLADYCRIVTVDKNNKVQEISVSHTDPKKITLVKNLYDQYKNRPESTHGVPIILRSGKSEIIEVIDEKILEPVKKNKILIKTVASIGLKSYMGVPLIARGKVIGAMTFSSVKKNRYYKKEDLRFAEEIGRRIALALDNIRLFKEAQEEIKERKRIEEDLRKSREQYKRLIDLSPMPMAVHMNGTLVYANKSAAELIGAVSSKEIIGKNIMEFIHPDFKEIVKNRVQLIYKKKMQQTDIIEEKFVRLDGEAIDVEIASLYVEYEGKPAIQVIIRDITQSKKAKENLKNSEKRFRTLIEQSTDAIQLVDPTGKILYTSESIKNVLGYTPEELLGLGVAPFIHPEDLPYFTRKVTELLKKPGIQLTLEYRVKHKDGTWAWLETTGVNHLDTPNINALVGTFRNITARKLHEEKLRYQKTLLEAQREVSPEGILVVSPDGKMTSYNKKFIQMWKFSKELIAKGQDELALQKATEQLIDPEGFIKKVKELYLKHEPNITKLYFKDGRVFDRFGSPLIGEDGTNYGYVWFFQDITQRIKLEKQKDEFLGIASHELKTPVTSLKAFGQVLQSRFAKAGDEKSYLLLGKMDTQINKLTSLIEDLLDISKIEAGRLQFHDEYFSFDELVDEITEEIQRTTEKHQLIIKGATGKTLFGDRERISQVITNFLTNAIKYSPHAEKIIITISANKNDATLSVKDFGVGISKEYIPHVFERFYRAKGKTHDTVPGMGLGLYISKEIITRQGGKIWVDSTKDKGSEFYFSLPLKK